MIDNFPSLWKELGFRIKEANKTTNYINTEKSSPRHILFKLSKVNDKKFSRQPKETPLEYHEIISVETLQIRRGWKEIFKILNGTISQG